MSVVDVPKPQPTRPLQPIEREVSAEKSAETTEEREKTFLQTLLNNVEGQARNALEEEPYMPSAVDVIRREVAHQPGPVRTNSELQIVPDEDAMASPIHEELVQGVSKVTVAVLEGQHTAETEIEGGSVACDVLVDEPRPVGLVAKDTPDATQLHQDIGLPNFAPIDPDFHIIRDEDVAVDGEDLSDFVSQIVARTPQLEGTVENVDIGEGELPENLQPHMLIGETAAGRPTILAGHELTEPYADGAMQFSDILHDYIETAEFENDMVRKEVEAIYARMDELAEQIFIVEQYEAIDSAVIEELRQQLFVTTKRLLGCVGVEVDDDTIRLYAELFFENNWYRPATSNPGELLHDPFRERKKSTDLRVRLSLGGSPFGYMVLGQHAVNFAVVRS